MCEKTEQTNVVAKKWYHFDIHSVRTIVLLSGVCVILVFGNILGLTDTSKLLIALIAVTYVLSNGLAECEREVVRLSQVVDTLIINSTKKGE